MTKDRAINWVIYNGEHKPTEGISDARWKAMVNHLKTQCLTITKDSIVYHDVITGKKN
jgi:hypothetical protein